MRYLAIASLTAVLFSAIGVAAQDRLDTCRGWQNYAYIVMQNRQQGLPISGAIEADIATHNSLSSPQADRDYTKNLILHAYRLPLERTDRMVEVASIEFAEDVFTYCLQ